MSLITHYTDSPINLFSPIGWLRYISWLFREGFYRLAGICRPFRACSTSLGAVQPEADVWLFSRGSQLLPGCLRLHVNTTTTRPLPGCFLEARSSWLEAFFCRLFTLTRKHDHNEAVARLFSRSPKLVARSFLLPAVYAYT